MKGILGRRINIGAEVLVLRLRLVLSYLTSRITVVQGPPYLLEIGDEVIPPPVVLVCLALDVVEVAPGVVVLG